MGVAIEAVASMRPRQSSLGILTYRFEGTFEWDMLQ